MLDRDKPQLLLSSYLGKQQNTRDTSHNATAGEIGSLKSALNQIAINYGSTKGEVKTESNSNNVTGKQPQLSKNEDEYLIRESDSDLRNSTSSVGMTDVFNKRMVFGQ